MTEPVAPVDTTANSSGRIVARNTFVLSGSELLARGLAAVGTIYLARVLGVTAFGVLGVALATLSYFVNIVTWGIELYGPREIAGDVQHLERILPSILFSRIILAGLLSLVLWAGSYWLLPADEAAVLSLFSLMLLATAVYTRWAHLGLERTALIAIARTIAELLKLGLLLLLVRGPETILWVPVTQFIGEFSGAVLLTWWLRRCGIRFHLHLDWGIIKRIHRESLPLMLTTVMGMWVYNADVFYLRLFRNSYEVGIYQAGYTLINFLAILGNTSRLSLVPTLTRMRGQVEEQQRLYHAAMAQLFALGLPVAVGGWLLAGPIIATVYGAKYEMSATALQILIWSVPFLLLRGILQATLVAAGRQQRVFHMTAWATVLSIGLNLLLVPRFGMLGCATVTVVTELVRMGVGLWFVRAEGFPLTAWSRYWRAVVATAVMGLLLWLIQPWALWFTLPLGGLAYAMTLILTGGVVFRRGKLPAITL